MDEVMKSEIFEAYKGPSQSDLIRRSLALTHAIFVDCSFSNHNTSMLTFEGCYSSDDREADSEYFTHVACFEPILVSSLLCSRLESKMTTHHAQPSSQSALSLRRRQLEPTTDV